MPVCNPWGLPKDEEEFNWRFKSVEVFVHCRHNRRIYGKLQIQRRTEAVARELGLLSVQEQVLLDFPPSR